MEVKLREGISKLKVKHVQGIAIIPKSENLDFRLLKGNLNMIAYRRKRTIQTENYNSSCSNTI